MSTLSIDLLEGRDLVAMDRNGLSDPYVVIDIGEHRKRSKIIYKTLDPVWNESFELALPCPPPPLVHFRLWDKDKVGKDDRMGIVIVPIKQLFSQPNCTLEDWFDVGRVQEKDTATGQLKLRLRYTGPIPAASGPAAAAAAPATVPVASASSSSSSSSTVPPDATPTRAASATATSSATSASDARLASENQELRAAIQELQQRHAELQQRYTQLEQNLLHSKLRKSQSMMDFEKESAPAASDEKFTPEQRYIAKVAFSKYDVDGNGTIDHHELKAILEELRKNGVLRMSDTLFKRYVDMNWKVLDADGSGAIDFEEFLEFLYGGSGVYGDLSLKLRSSDFLVRAKEEASVAQPK